MSETPVTYERLSDAYQLLGELHADGLTNKPFLADGPIGHLLVAMKALEWAMIMYGREPRR